MEYLPIFIITLVIWGISTAILLYACCYVSGECSREEEKRDAKR